MGPQRQRGMAEVRTQSWSPLCLLQACSSNAHGFLSNLATPRSWENDTPWSKRMTTLPEAKCSVFPEKTIPKKTKSNNNNNNNKITIIAWGMSCRLIHRRIGAYRITPSPHLLGNDVFLSLCAWTVYSVLKFRAALRAVILSSQKFHFFCWILNVSLKFITNSMKE